VKTLKTKLIVPWLMLVSRTVLFALFQLLIAGVLSISGSSVPWDNSAAWWTFSVIFTNIVSILLLVRLFRQDNKRYFDFIHFSPQTVWEDIGIYILLLLVFIPIATYPNQWLAKLLFGFEEIAFGLMFLSPYGQGSSAFCSQSQLRLQN
jgi:hypothetical protein